MTEKNRSYSILDQPPGEGPKPPEQDLLAEAHKAFRAANLNPNDPAVVKAVLSIYRRTPGTDRIQRLYAAAQEYKRRVQEASEKKGIADGKPAGKVPGETPEGDVQLQRVLGMKTAKQSASEKASGRG